MVEDWEGGATVALGDEVGMMDHKAVPVSTGVVLAVIQESNLWEVDLLQGEPRYLQLWEEFDNQKSAVAGD